MNASLPATTSWVVRCPNWVGDIVMATPVFECLRNNFPDAEITALIRPYARGIIERSPWFDRVVDCDDKSIAGLRKIRAAFAGRAPDAGLLLTNTTHSFLTLKLAGIRNVYGYQRNLRRFFLTGGPKPEREGSRYRALPMQDYYLALCHYLGLVLPDNPRPRLYIDEALEQAGQRYLAEQGIAATDMLIGLNPGASFGSSKCWPVTYYAQLAEMLQQHYRCKIILLAGPGEEDLAARIVAASRATIINTGEAVLDLAQLKPVIRRCNLLVTNDTGPRHFAVAFDVPAIVLMGPTNPVYTAANLEQTTIIRRELPCSPCHKKVCPYDHHACMNEITPENVFSECRRYLTGAAA